MRRVLTLALTLVASGCAAIIGADFDDARPRSAADAGDGSAIGADDAPADDANGPLAQPRCEEARKVCSGACVPKDVEHGCGASSCVPCARSAHGKTACEDNRCNLHCDVGFARCKDGCCPAANTPVAMGSLHSCALTKAGDVACWGMSDIDDLPHGPAVASGTKATVSVAVGTFATCAKSAMDRASCWGTNLSGQLGDGTFVDRSAPQLVAVDGTLVDLRLGYVHGCATTDDGSLLCWGANSNGQLGDGTTTTRAVPQPVPKLRRVTAMVAPGSVHTCALTLTGSVLCWGDNGFKEVQPSGAQFLEPIPVTLPRPARFVAAGLRDSCAILDDGHAYCWGDNQWGQIAAAGTSPSGPTAFGDPASMRAVAIGDTFVCALREAGTVTCRGKIRCATNDAGVDANPPTPGSFTSVTASSGAACGVLTDGRLYCWGCGGAYRLGASDSTKREAFVQLP